MIVVGNKCDMIKKREVELKDAKEITKNYGCPLLESSAKNDININEIFYSLIDQVLFPRCINLNFLLIFLGGCEKGNGYKRETKAFTLYSSLNINDYYRLS
jgi:hypothetical protein